MENKFTFIDLFAGIGGIRLGFEQAGGKCVFSSEIDKFACQTYQANFGEYPAGDITKINAKDIPSFDILAAGFPCQPFSPAGKKLGFDDSRGNMIYEIKRIADYHKPKIIFLENVPAILKHINKIKGLFPDYFCSFSNLNSSDFYVPQNRLRAYIVLFKDEKYFNDTIWHFSGKTVELSNGIYKILETVYDAFGGTYIINEGAVPEKYTLSDKMWAGHQRRKEKNKEDGKGFGFSLLNFLGQKTRTLTARYGKDGSEILIAQERKNPRKLTPRECARLQGFPDSFIIPVSDTQAYKQFGNSVTVPVVKAIAQEIAKAFE